jgi:ion channel POLLUX/CASTOR
MADVMSKPQAGNSVSNAAGDPSASDSPSIVARLRYRFDLALSRGPSVVIAYLGIITALVILVASLIISIFSITGINGEKESHNGFIENFWLAMTRVLDPGTFSGENGWPIRIIMLLVTLSGVFIVGSLIGLIANSVDQQIEELSKGRSNVIETDHTLILGWSARVPAIVSELVIANESLKKSAVVILADVDKTEMEETLRDAIEDSKTTRIVCRSGEPWLTKNLEIANLAGARSVVIVGDGSDTATVKTLLAIRTARAGAPGKGHVVAEVVDNDTAVSLRSLLGDELVTVSSDAIVAELTAQACRQRGLSGVFRELLDFDGDELYFAPFPELIGKTYAETQMAFEKCAVIGILKSGGGVQLNPAPSDVFAAGDQLIAVVEDDSLFLVTQSSVTPRILACEDPERNESPRRIVIVGWSTLGPRVIAELDEFLDSRTTIELLLDPELVDADLVRSQVTTRNVTLEVSELGGGPEIIAAHAARRSFHEVIVLGYRKAMADDEADARTLLTLLAFNQVRQSEDIGPVRIVAEMLDQRNAPLAEATGVDDFVVSDELTSLMLAQLSERRELSQVFDDLFDRTGCSIELRIAPLYGAHEAKNFADIVATASSRGDSAIGYRRASSGQVIVNPAKSEPLSLNREDEVLVIAPGLPI